MSTVTSKDPAFEIFLAGCEKIYIDDHQKHGYHFEPDTLSFTEGKRYIKSSKVALLIALSTRLMVTS